MPGADRVEIPVEFSVIIRLPFGGSTALLLRVASYGIIEKLLPFPSLLLPFTNLVQADIEPVRDS